MMNPHFSSPFNFGAIPKEIADYKKARVTILPVPYDATTSYKPGARDGPAAIISASRSMELYDIELCRNISDIGICTLDEMDILIDSEKMANRVYEAVKHLLSEGKFVVMLGGEHSISFGAVKAHNEKLPGLSVLHIDAHADLRDENAGIKFDHGCVARRISEICPLVQVGIRSMSEEEAEFIKTSKHKVIYAEQIANSSNDSWMDEAISALSENVYVTIDMDAFDPGIISAVGTPEPGGFQWYQFLTFMKKLSEQRNIAGFDVVELSPQPHNIAPDFTAAKLIYKLIGYFLIKQ